MSRANLATAALLVLAVAIATRIASDRLAAWRFVGVPDSHMAPTVPEGALAGLQRASVDEVAVGDVLLYASPNVPGPPVLLRVRDELAPRGSRGTGRLLRLQTDASAAGSGEPPWDAELHGIVWRLALVLPGAGWLARFDLQQVVRAVATVTAAAIVAPSLSRAVATLVRRFRTA